MKQLQRFRELFMVSFVLLTACGQTTTAPLQEPSGAGPLTPLLAGGAVHTCLLGTSGNVLCWGRYGSNPSVPATTSSPTLVTPADGSVKFTSITAGHSTCGITAEGRAYCWGPNLYGQLGDGTTTARAQPTPVATALRFTAIESGAQAICGIATGGAAYCWGSANLGMLGTGLLPEGSKQLVPGVVSGNHKFHSISGGLFFCGITQTSASYCWGVGPGSFDVHAFAVEGDCTATYYVSFSGAGCATPTPVASPSSFTSLGIGSNGLTMCALETAGIARCWGEGWLGTLGNGQAGPGVHAVAPVAVSSVQTFKQIASASTHVCALTSDGTAYCWGNNFRGYLGTGTAIAGSSIPVAVAGGHRFVSLAAGAYHSCGLKSNEEVWCWGAGTEGQLGHGGGLVDSNVPVQVDFSGAPAV